jgi:pyruvate dehydrogenase E2 component (dihydrolipoamide acetyltransferase)
MARFEFKLPDIGEGVYEGEIVTWHVRPGELVAEDQPVVEVMTDKATVTIGAPKAGKILETRGAVGEIVNVNSVLVVFELDGHLGDLENGDNGSAKNDGGAAASAVGDLRDDLPCRHGAHVWKKRSQPRQFGNWLAISAWTFRWSGRRGLKDA